MVANLRAAGAACMRQVYVRGVSVSVGLHCTACAQTAPLIPQVMPTSWRDVWPPIFLEWQQFVDGSGGLLMQDLLLICRGPLPSP